MDTENLKEKELKEEGRMEKEESGNDEIVNKEQEYLEGWKRALADYNNLKKDTDVKSREWIELGNLQVLNKLVPIYSNFKQAVSYIPEDQKSLPWVTGISYILTNMTDMLKELGITPIETVGKKFDPNLHDALSEDESEGESGIIVREVGAGFMKDGRVLIHAKVVVRK